MASLPVISAVSSTFFCSSITVATAMTNSLPQVLSLASDFQHLRNLLFVLSLVAEAVRTLPVPLDLVLQPGLISILVLPPGFPLAVVVGEFGLVHHGDAFFHRAHSFADAATAAGLHVGVVETFRRHVKAGIRA